MYTCAYFDHRYPIECVPFVWTIPDIIMYGGVGVVLAWLVTGWVIQLGQSFYNWLQQVWWVNLFAVLQVAVLGYVWLWTVPVTNVPDEDFLDGLS